MPRRNNSPGFEVRVETCAAEFLDSGGVNPYGNNENGILTFCPDLPGDRIQLDFLSADIKANDTLSVYDGNSDSATLLLTITNITPAGFERTVVRASQRNPQGCLTVTFTSVDIAVANPYDGWFSRVSCFTPEIEPGTPEDLFRNDDPSGDEIEVFDLSENDEAVLNGLNPFEFQVSYYTSEANALSGSNPLNPEYTNTSNPETIYSRLENPSTGFSAIDSFLLFVNRIPDIFQVPDLTACDTDSDGVTTFRLQDHSEVIYSGRENLRVVYYATADDAVVDQNGLNPETYSNTASPQTIYYRLIDTETGAYALGDFVIRVTEPPPVNAVPDVISCDKGNGNAERNLNTIAEELTMGQSGLQVTWHQSREEAESGLNPIPTPYTHSQNTSLYARVTDTASQCPAIVAIPFIFYPLPENTLEADYLICPELTNSTVLLETGLGTTNYTFSWFLNDVQLIDQTDAFLETDQAGIYTVLIEDLNTGCGFKLTAEVRLASPPTGYEITTEPGQFGNRYQVTVETTDNSLYFFSLDDGPLQKSPSFESVLPGPHRLRIATEGGCEVLNEEFDILGYPTFFTPNGDNINETWKVSRAPGISGLTVYIFNRFGALITVLTESRPDWNGTLNGKDLPSDTYWFRVEYTEDEALKIAKGYFALKR